MKRLIKGAVLIAATTICGNLIHADVTLPKIFSNDMVLQREQNVPVWGWGEVGEKVTVKFAGQSVTTEVDQSGKWRLELTPLKLGEPRTLTVQGNNIINLTNVLVGEVWLCSGQSNMEFGIGNMKDGAAEIANANHPNIRLIYVPKTVSSTPSRELPSNCTWRICTPENITKGSHKGGFSATAYYYGRELHQKLGVPVGIIQSAWGGTRIEPWTTVAGFKSVTEVNDIYKHVIMSNKKYRNAVKKSLDYIKSWEVNARKALATNGPIPAIPKWPSSAIRERQHPTALYNAMIHPMVPFAIKGVIWYQGESNRGDAMLYYHKMRALINGWRKLWNNEKLPFYFVQLAPFTYRGGDQMLPEIWEAQSEAMNKIPYTGMAIINDIGNLRDIHPKNKQEVGRRLALWALVKDYGKDIKTYCGPMFKSSNIEGSKIRASFNHTGIGLASRDGKPLNYFEIAGADGKFVKAEAVIDGSDVVISSSTIKIPVQARFAWDQLAVPNLMNKEGLPASAFRLVVKKKAKRKPFTCSGDDTHGDEK